MLPVLLVQSPLIVMTSGKGIDPTVLLLRAVTGRYNLTGLCRAMWVEKPALRMGNRPDSHRAFRAQRT